MHIRCCIAKVIKLNYTCSLRSSAITLISVFTASFLQFKTYSRLWIVKRIFRCTGGETSHGNANRKLRGRSGTTQAIIWRKTCCFKLKRRLFVCHTTFSHIKHTAKYKSLQESEVICIKKMGNWRNLQLLKYIKLCSFDSKNKSLKFLEN